MNSGTSHGHSKRLKQRKVLLMGKSGAGKSSMRTIVFNNYVARDVRRLGATIDVEHSNIRFMGNLTLNLWDCGGQDGFTENFLRHQREQVFSSVAVLIYVFDVESREFNADVSSYGEVVEALEEWSPGAKVFVLVHKMDLLVGLGAGPGGGREKVFLERREHVRNHSAGFKDTVEFFPTSIWDQSLYRAWMRIVRFLIPNAAAIEELLGRLADAIDARECVLYERTTCLMITHITRGSEMDNPFKERFEQLSSILKTHKQSLARYTSFPASSANFAELQIKTSRYHFFITRLTENTNLAACIPSSEQGFNAARMNVRIAAPRFIELDTVSKKEGVEEFVRRAAGGINASSATAPADNSSSSSSSKNNKQQQLQQ